MYTWDITYMGRTVRGLFYYAYVVKDLFDRSIVGWAVHEEESEKHSRALFARILNGGKVKLKALHADNGHPMKGVTLMALLQSSMLQSRTAGLEPAMTTPTSSRCSRR